jgi:hypothetical protein
MTLVESDWNRPRVLIIPASVKPVIPAFGDRLTETTTELQKSHKPIKLKIDATTHGEQSIESEYIRAIVLTSAFIVGSVISVIVCFVFYDIGRYAFIVPSAFAAIGFANATVFNMKVQKGLHKKMINQP